MVGPDLPWLVIVWNDPVNLMSYVVYVFQQVFGYSREKATKLMLEVHHDGKSVVSHGTREKAEIDVARLHAHGLWATMEKDQRVTKIDRRRGRRRDRALRGASRSRRSATSPRRSRRCSAAGCPSTAPTRSATGCSRVPTSTRPRTGPRPTSSRWCTRTSCGRSRTRWRRCSWTSTASTDRRDRLTLELDRAGVEQWVGALNDVRLTIGVVLGVTEDDDGEDLPPDDPRRPGWRRTTG